jgi:hypothetical protein
VIPAWRNLIAVALGLCCSGRPAIADAQQPIDQKELAAYRLTEPVFERFARGARLIVAASRKEPRLDEPPLFTKEIAVSGEAVAMAAQLQARLEEEHAFRSALFAAEIDAREFTKFALTLFAARLAHGFVQAGLIHVMPETIAGANVAFTAMHQAHITALFAEMGIK